MYLDKTILEQLMYFKNAKYRIEDIHLFRDLDQSNLQLSHDIIKDCPIVKATKGQVVLDANSSGSRLFIVLRGTLGITKLNEDNNHIENSITQIDSQFTFTIWLRGKVFYNEDDEILTLPFAFRFREIT